MKKLENFSWQMWQVGKQPNRPCPPRRTTPYPGDIRVQLDHALPVLGHAAGVGAAAGHVLPARQLNTL